MTILVSGATGFVGGNITRHLLDAGLSVRALSRSTGRTIAKFAAHEVGRRALADGRLTFAEADVTQPATLTEAVKGVGAVVQATQFTGAPMEDPAHGLTYEAVDRDGTVNLLEAITKAYGVSTSPQAPARFPAGSPHFFYVSGISVSAEAPESWNRAKWQAEEAIRRSGLEWTIVRACWAYGPYDTALNRIIGYSDLLPFVPIFGRGEEPLTPLLVEDIGRLFALLTAHPARARDTTFGLGGADTVTLNEFLLLALRAMGRNRRILHIPRPVGKVQGALLQRLPGRRLTPGAVDFVSQGGAVSAADRELLAERFPEFSATALRDGLASYLGTGRPAV